MSWGCLQELDVESGGQKTWELSTDEVTVGRLTNTKADNKLTIKWPKAYISGHHFSIKRSSDGLLYEIFDKSSNGTFVNATLVGKGNSSVLNSGDVIQLRFKHVDKIILTFKVFEKGSAEHSIIVTDRSSKRKRVETEDQEQQDKKDAKGSRHESNLSSIKITALEQDSKQQEARIEAYITKLETSARENSNLLRELKAAQDASQEKGLQLEDLQQQCAVQEAHTATIEARARKLEESLQTQKTYGEKLRGQLAVSEERCTHTSELLLKVETLTDELNHRKNQSDSRSTMCDELSLSLENERKQRESVELELHDCKLDLGRSQKEAHEYQRLNDVLQAEQRLAKRLLDDSQAKNELLEAMATQLQAEEDGNATDFRTQISAISSSIGRLHAAVKLFESSHPPLRTSDTVAACLAKVAQLTSTAGPTAAGGVGASANFSAGDHPPLSHQPQEQEQGLAGANCTQVPAASVSSLCTQGNEHTPDRMKKTTSADSTMAFSRNTENLEFTQMVGATVESTDMPKAGYNTLENRQCSVYDTISMTEEEADLGKIEDGSS
jgi:pSer/pThr/pTyr-binding forkhead associated (FHA) protein